MSGDLSTCKRSLLTDSNDTKRQKLEDSPTPICMSNSEEPAVVKEEALVKPSPPDRIKRKKVILLLSYSGWGYLGMQRNPGAKTIEDDLLRAMYKSGLITEEHYKQPQKMLFQRAARTDKGVSAVRQVVSLKLPEDSDIELINKELPDQIRVVCKKRTTKGFNAKTSCDARTYSYLLPTFAFDPSSEEPNNSFRITENIRENINDILKMFVGTHNFHNFTSKRGFAEASSISERYVYTGCNGGVRRYEEQKEYFELDVYEPMRSGLPRMSKMRGTLLRIGQSFMQHHIRKMIGLTIAIVRGHTTTDTITRSFKSEPLDIPKAPGLGLMLEEVHYDWYNNQFGKDGVHEALEWSKYEDFIQDFKDKHIISTVIKTEKEEKSMASWMATLSGHSYSVREERPPTSVKIAAKLNENATSNANLPDVKSESKETDEPCAAMENAVLEARNVCKKEEKEIPCDESGVLKVDLADAEPKQEIKTEDLID